jgi:hypothetical protein
MTRRFRAAALAVALLSLSIAAPPSAGEEDTKPSFWVEETELDLGTVIAGSIATATFVFRNDGPEDVHIIRAKPS